MSGDAIWEHKKGPVWVIVRRQEQENNALRYQNRILQRRLRAIRSGAREAEGSGLLSRPASNGRVGSNPTPTVSECIPVGKRGVASTTEKQALGWCVPPGLAARPARASAATIPDSAGASEDDSHQPFPRVGRPPSTTTPAATLSSGESRSNREGKR